jgi:SAM-dependent methyltransferase
MARFGLLILPASNRVYSESAVALTQAELALFGAAGLVGPLGAIATETIGGVPYVTFEADRFDERAADHLANLSSAYALFRLEGDVLRPVELRPLARYDDDLVTIQKYPGKTNEQFTKLLLNATLVSSAFAGDMLTRRFRVLDPLCGRGTTLNHALRYGFDAAGVERDQKDFEAYAAFLTTWLRRKHIKHQVETTPVRRERQVVARRFHATLAATREEHRAGTSQQVEVFSVDTVRAGEFFRAGTFDLVVADAPYGVQHGSRTAERGLARSPLDLLTLAVAVWAALLRPGGAMGISWNTFVARRDELTKIMLSAGLEPCDSGPYLELSHRVDQSIVRDVLIARKPV